MPSFKEFVALIKSFSFFRSIRFYYVLIVVSLGFYTYGASIYARFNFDDIELIVSNPYLANFMDLPVLLSAGRPLRALSFFIDYQLWGLDPQGYHFTNIFLHISVSVVIYFLVLKFTKKDFFSFIASLLFLLHPANSEAVIGISHRKEMLCALFLLFAYLCFLSSRKNKFYYLLTIIFYFLALLSKQVAMSFPFLLLAETFIIAQDKVKELRRRLPWIFLFILIPLVAFALSFSDFRLFGKVTLADLTPKRYFQILGTSFRAFLVYLKLAFFPAHLRLDYYFPLSSSFFELKVIISILIWILSWFFGFYLSRKKPLLGFGVIWFLINHLFIMNLIPANAIIAERYLYLPLVGISIFIAGVVNELYETRSIKSLSFFRASLIKGFWDFVILFLLSFFHIYAYKRILFEDVLYSPFFMEKLTVSCVICSLFCALSILIFSVLEKKYIKNSRILELFFFWMVLAILYLFSLLVFNKFIKGGFALPELAFSEKWTQWQSWLSEVGTKIDRPLELFKFPSGSLIRELFNIGFFVIFLQGILFFLYHNKMRNLLEVAPARALSWIIIIPLLLIMIAKLSYRQRDWGSEVSLWKSTVRENPASIIGLNNLGRAYIERQKYDLAVECFIKAYCLAPWRDDLILNLANTFLRKGDPETAEYYYQWVLRLNPFNFIALINLGNLFVVQKNYPKAIEKYLEALKIKPDSAHTYHNLSYCFLELKDYNKALIYALKGLKIAPSDPKLNQLRLEILKEVQPSRQ